MCTGIRFSDDEGNMYAGRNLDWECGYGEGITITPRNYERQYAFVPAATGHATIGTCIIVNDMPLYFDCGNEKGLYIAGLNFPGYAQFEKDQVPGKTNIATYEFLLWVASEFATVDEVEAALEQVAIVGKQVSDQYPVAQLHFFICDAKRSIVVEYMADSMPVATTRVARSHPRSRRPGSPTALNRCDQPYERSSRSGRSCRYRLRLR